MSLESKIRERAFDILRNRVSTGRIEVEPYASTGSDEVGFGFWDDVSGVFKKIVPLYKPVAEALGGKKKRKTRRQPKKVAIVADIIEQEKIAPNKQGGNFFDSVGEEVGKFTNILKLIGVGKKPKQNRVPTKRAMLVKKIMKEKHLSLPQASSYIKKNNLI